MKKLFAVMLICSASQGLFAQAPDASKPDQPLVINEKEHDFGNIQQGRPVTYIFTITNTGAKPILLENVQASCGCTTPEWSREPINPGATSELKVGYNAAAEGQFHKSVTILYNNGKTLGLIIKGTVYKSPEGSAPANASIVMLKQINNH